MNRILLLINEPLSDASPNAICMERVIKHLEKLGVYTDVLCFSDRFGTEELSEGIKIYTVSNKFINASGLVNRIIRKICYECICPDINMLCARAYLMQAAKLLNDNNYDAIVASSGGFFTQLAALKLKEKYKINTISIFLDPPVSLNFLYKRSRIYYRWMLINEKNIFKSFEYVLLEENLFDEYYKNNKLNEKVRRIGIPLITEKEQSIVSHQDSMKKIVFLGTLWMDIRNPKYAISLFEKLKDCQLCFWGGQQTYYVLKELGYERLYMGYAKHSDVERIIYEADYLLNISNDNIVQTPSKIYEYISYGKPIINVVKDKRDKTTQLISKYGNGISIIEGNDEFSNVEKFISKPITILPYSKIQKNFSEYTAEKFADIMMDCCSFRQKECLE